VDQLLAAKAASGKSFDDIAAECGWTNAYTAQLFFNQVRAEAGGWTCPIGVVGSSKSQPVCTWPSAPGYSICCICRAAVMPRHCPPGPPAAVAGSAEGQLRSQAEESSAAAQVGAPGRGQ
jgi:hypothetical protein